MDAERLNKIEEIYHDASLVEPAGRASFLDLVCGADTALRDEVESLLAVQTESRNFLETPPESLAAELLEQRNAAHNLNGREIGHYRINKLIGAGGMGEVYLAEDIKLRRNVALKILPARFEGDSDRRARFEKEAYAISALNHPNIITIFEIEQSAELSFIATEFIDGRTLGEIIREGSMDASQVVAIAVQIARALESAHSVGIVHRDLKPANVMIRPDGIVKVLDFGLAKLQPPVTTENNAPASRTAVLMGTAAYMSPEQARHDAVDVRSDIFSFGIVLYEMLTGRLPFDGDTSYDVIASIIDDEPKPLGDVRPEFAAVVEKCLRKDKFARYGSIADVRRELEELRETTSRVGLSQEQPARNAMTADHTARPTTTIDENSRRSRGRLIAAIVFLAIIVAGVFAYRNSLERKEIRSIAVMPFVNDSENQDVDYLSDGMTENLINSLSTIPQLSIKSRSTVFRYKGKSPEPTVFGRELKVDAVLIGHLVQRGENLKVSLELVDTFTQDVLWSGIYERKMANLVALESEIASNVSQNLRIKLSSTEQAEVARTNTNNSEAQQLYLKGRFHWNKRQAANFEKAVGYFNDAIAKDPNLAIAYAGLADTFALMPLYGNYPPKEYMPKAKQAALRAIELDPRIAAPHASLAYISNTFDFDWDNAEREYNLALELDPKYATAHQWYAEHLAFRGRSDDALREIGIALDLDPFSVVINRMKGNILLFAGRTDDAIAQLTKSVELFPENSTVQLNLGDAYAAKKDYAEAVGHYLSGLKIDGYTADALERLKSAFAKRGWNGFWSAYRDLLLEYRESVFKDDRDAYLSDEPCAFAYAASGNKEKSLEYLYRAYENREAVLVSIRMTEAYSILNDEPRYKELLRKIGPSE